MQAEEAVQVDGRIRALPAADGRGTAMVGRSA